LKKIHIEENFFVFGSTSSLVETTSLSKFNFQGIYMKNLVAIFLFFIAFIPSANSMRSNANGPTYFILDGKIKKTVHLDGEPVVSDLKRYVRLSNGSLFPEDQVFVESGSHPFSFFQYNGFTLTKSNETRVSIEGVSIDGTQFVSREGKLLHAMSTSHLTLGSARNSVVNKSIVTLRFKNQVTIELEKGSTVYLKIGRDTFVPLITKEDQYTGANLHRLESLDPYALFIGNESILKTVDEIQARDSQPKLEGKLVGFNPLLMEVLSLKKEKFESSKLSAFESKQPLNIGDLLDFKNNHERLSSMRVDSWGRLMITLDVESQLRVFNYFSNSSPMKISPSCMELSKALARHRI